MFSELLWKLIILFLPGVISVILIRYLTINRHFSSFYFIVFSITIGLFDFLVLELIYFVFNLVFWQSNQGFGNNLHIWETLLKEKDVFHFNEIFYSFLVSIPLGLLISSALNHKVIITIAQKLGVTKRFGDDDVWTFFLNSPNTEWIFVRDNHKNLTYYGHLDAYSTSYNKREILLSEVKVYYSDTWEPLYDVNVVFLELEDAGFSIEIPKFSTYEQE